MQKSVFISSLVAASLLAIPATAQRFMECGATLQSKPAGFAALDNLALGVTDVAQLMAIADPANPGKYLCMFTVTQAGGANYDIKSGTFDPATGTVALDNYADLMNVAGAVAGDDMFQGSMDPSGLIAVADTPTTHPVGGGLIICAQRLNLTQQFGDTATGAPAIVTVSGVPSGYIDPHICVVRGQLSLLYVSGTDIAIADLTVNATSATATNIRTAIKNIPGANTLHSPTPIVDAAGNAHHLICSQAIAGSGSDSVYLPATEQGNLEASMIYDDGSDWLANPASFPQTGTAIYADAAGGYGTPLGHEFFATSGGKVPAAGGTVELHTVVPYGSPMVNDVIFHNFGIMAPGAGIGPGGLGIVASGDLCLNVLFGMPAGPMAGSTDFIFSFPVLAGQLPAGIVIDGQSIAFSPTTGAINMSNNWVLEN